MRTLFALTLLLAAIPTANAKEDRKCIREMHELYDDMAVARRQCNPNNFVTNPNEFGWVRNAPECVAKQIKGAGAKQQKDAPCE